MKNYKVNVDREKPSSDEILSRRNFDGLMKQYQAAGGAAASKPFWKKMWFAGTVVTAVVATIALVLYNNSTATAPATAPATANVVNTRNAGDANTTPALATNGFAVGSKKLITPPLKGVDVAFTKFSINAITGGTVKYLTGSKLIFPVNAFVDANGNKITGNVEIRYREFRDPVDIFLAGIPMQYDSAGVPYQFESAGMMEVSAFSNGKPVFLDKNKQVEIQYSSENASSNFSIYLFDTASGNWSFRGKDKVMNAVPVNANTNVLTDKQRQDKIDVLKTKLTSDLTVADKSNPIPTEPRKPLVRNKAKNRFTVDCDPKEFPEILAYKDVIWQVDDSKEPFDPKAYSITWEEISLNKGDADGKYNVVLKKGLTMLSIPVFPTYEGSGLANAQAEFDKLYANYTAAVTKRKAAEQTAQNNYEMAINAGGLNATVPVNAQDAAASTNVLRVFSISGFGIYNCDHAGTYPTGSSHAVTFQDVTGAALTGLSVVYHVVKEKFGLFMHTAPATTISFSSTEDNMIWGVVNGKLYYAKNDQFTRLDSQMGAMTLTAWDNALTSPDQMKQFFGIGAEAQ